MTNSVDIHVGKMVRKFRILKGMTQAELGKVVGVQFQQIQKYESGQNRISAGCMWQMSAALDVPVAVFFEGLYAEDDGSGNSEDSSNLPEPRESLELVRNFSKLSPKLRRRVMELVRQIVKPVPPAD